MTDYRGTSERLELGDLIGEARAAYERIKQLNLQIQHGTWAEDELARMHAELYRALARFRAARRAAATA